MAPPQGLKLLHSDIKGNTFSSQDMLHQMGQYLAWSILGARELKLYKQSPWIQK